MLNQRRDVQVVTVSSLELRFAITLSPVSAQECISTMEVHACIVTIWPAITSVARSVLRSVVTGCSFTCSATTPTTWMEMAALLNARLSRGGIVRTLLTKRYAI